MNCIICNKRTTTGGICSECINRVSAYGSKRKGIFIENKDTHFNTGKISRRNVMDYNSEEDPVGIVFRKYSRYDIIRGHNKD